MQDEVSRKEATAQQAKRWLDQAQGQLQNTQTALTVKEVEVKELSAQLDQAAADYARLRVGKPLLQSSIVYSLCTGVVLFSGHYGTDPMAGRLVHCLLKCPSAAEAIDRAWEDPVPGCSCFAPVQF